MTDEAPANPLSLEPMSSETAPSPRVALVHDWLTGMRGGEKVLEAIAELFPEAPIYTLFHFPGSVSAALESHPIRTSWLQRAPFLRKRYRHYLPFFPAAIESFDFSGFDLIVSSSHCVAKGVVPGPGAVHVCYCHTPMRYAWDQEHAYFPKRHGLVARLRAGILSRLRTWDVASSGRTDQYVANSHFVASRISRYYARQSEVIAPPVEVDSFGMDSNGVDSKAVESKAPTTEASPFCLSVAALAPYKLHQVAIEACRKLSMPLVIVGEGPERGRLERLSRQHDGDSRAKIRLAGRVDSAELRRLYRQASVFVQPGIEDFGIAAVEALASGTPIAAAGAGGILDIVEPDTHGVLYPPEQGAEGLAAAIDKAIRLRCNPEVLRQRAARFSKSDFQARFRRVVAATTEAQGLASPLSSTDSNSES